MPNAEAQPNSHISCGLFKIAQSVNLLRGGVRTSHLTIRRVRMWGYDAALMSVFLRSESYRLPENFGI